MYGLLQISYSPNSLIEASLTAAVGRQMIFERLWRRNILYDLKRYIFSVVLNAYLIAATRF